MESYTPDPNRRSVFEDRQGLRTWLNRDLLIYTGSSALALIALFVLVVVGERAEGSSRIAIFSVEIVILFLLGVVLYGTLDSYRRELTLRSHGGRRYKALFDEASGQARELTLLEIVRSKLSNELDLDSIYRSTVKAISETFGYTQVSCYDLVGDTLVLRCQLGYDRVIDRIALGRGVAGRVAATGVSALLPDVAADPAFLGAIPGICSEVCIPIFDSGRVIGVLNVESVNNVKLGERDLRLMESFCRHVEIVLARARLFEGLKQANAELEERVRVRTETLSALNDKLRAEIAERLVFQKRIELSLAEKEILLKEIHHRVKNNLQIITSLLNLQVEALGDSKLRDALRDSQARIHSLSLIHEKLYLSDSLASVDFDGYAEGLMGYLEHSLGFSRQGISFDILRHGAKLPLDAALPCGLILNELVSNCIKHAFKGREDQSMRISIELEEASDGNLCFRVADNGIGLPAGMDITGGGSLGLQLVDVLGKQLGAKVEVSTVGGTEFTIRFARE